VAGWSEHKILATHEWLGTEWNRMKTESSDQGNRMEPNQVGRSIAGSSQEIRVGKLPEGVVFRIVDFAQTRPGRRFARPRP